MAANADDMEVEQNPSRISDAEEEPIGPVLPINGYENMPLVSLELAIKPLVSILPGIENYAKIAKQRCQNPPDDGLTIDESASIMLYTMDWLPRNTCLYFVLNDILRSESRYELDPWLLYLKLFFTALSHLPSTRQHVYRGVKKDFHNQYLEKETITWWGFSSCTSLINVLRSKLFLGTQDTRTLNEAEVLLLPATQFRVAGCISPSDELYIIQLEEIEPTVSLPQPAVPNKETDEKCNPHPPLTCNGRQCVTCGRCCDWYYTGHSEDWQWIRNFRSWNHYYAERWRNGKYCDQFKRHDGSKCNRYSYYVASYFVRFVSFGTFDGSALLGHLCVCD